MITIYDPKATEFSTLGLGAMQPAECSVEEMENGMFSLRMQVEIEDDLRWTRIQPGCIIKAPTPMRETPRVQTTGTTSTSVTRSIYKVVTSGGERLHLRAKPSLSAKILGGYKPGTKVIRESVSGDWAEVILLDGGATGWMWADNLEFVETMQDTIISNGPGIVVQPKQTREQLFRVVAAETNAAGRILTVRANHIFYDLSGNIVGSQYEAKDTAADVAVAELLSRATNAHDFNVYCSATAPVSGDFTGKSIVNALLDPYEGIAVQADAVVIRDNWDIYIVPRETRDRGFQIRHGKNLIGAIMTVDRSELVTRIVPIGMDAEGERLYLDGQIYIDSPHIDDYPVPYAVEKEYDVSVGEEEEEFETEEEARAELRRLVQEDYDAGCDLPAVSLDVDFVSLENTDEYAQYASLYSTHMGDLVQVIAPFALIDAKLRVTGYVFNCLRKRYDSVTLGDMTEMGGTIYGTDIAVGSISGNRLVNGSVDGNVLANAAIGFAKINTAAVKQLSAEALQAVTAYIGELAAGNITTDELYASIATIAAAQITAANIEKANIDWANIDTLNANIADISLAKIATADIDFAKVKDLVTDTAIITEGVGGQLYIARLAVTEANMVQLTVGSLMLKAEDGSFVRLVADSSGGVTTEAVTVEGDNIANATISGTNLIENTITARELNVEKIFADEALIRAIKAANIDVADLFAAQATIEQLDSWIISANTIQALEGALDLWASEKINIAVGDLDLTTAENVQNSSVTITPGMVQIETPVFSVQNESTGMTLDEEGLSAEYVSAPNLAEKYTGKSEVTVGGGTSAAVMLTAANFEEYFDVTTIYYSYAASTADGNLRLTPGNLGVDSSQAICTLTAKKALSYMEIWYRCKSEVGADTLYGNRNNATIIATVSGDQSYQRAWYGSVASGDSFTFNYTKDSSVSTSGEEVYIDFISTISAGSSTEGDYKSLSALASELNGRLLAQDLTVTLVSDVTGGAEFKNIIGGKITINGSGYSMNNPLNIANCTSLFEINSLNFSYTAKGYARYDNCTVLLNSCVFNVASGTAAEPALFITNGARVDAVNTEFYNTIGNLLVLTNMAYCVLEDCAGYANRTITMQVFGGSQLRACGTYPAGSIYGGPEDTASVVELNGTASSGSAQTTPSALTEQTFACTSSDTCRGSSSWDGSGYIWQGYTSSGVHRGYMWFSGLASAISGKTIVSATLKLTRVNGIGRSGATTLYAYYTSKTAASGTQSVSTAYGGEIGSIANDETKVFDLPVELIQRIADTGTGGVALYSGESSSMEGRKFSANYCKLYGAGSDYAPELSVTYQ